LRVHPLRVPLLPRPSLSHLRQPRPGAVGRGPTPAPAPGELLPPGLHGARIAAALLRTKRPRTRPRGPLRRRLRDDPGDGGADGTTSWSPCRTPHLDPETDLPPTPSLPGHRRGTGPGRLRPSPPLSAAPQGPANRLQGQAPGQTRGAPP